MKYKSVLKKAGNIVGHIFTIMLAIPLCFNLYILVASHVFGVEAPSVLGISNAIVVSGSMSDTLEVNDMIIIHRKKSYSKYDVITFKHQDSLVTHRIIGITPEGFRTKGDANNAADTEPVNAKDVVGKVIIIIPKIGSIIKWLRTPLGMTGLVLAIFILIELPSVISKRKNGNEK